MILKNFANCDQSHLCTRLCLSSLFISLFMILKMALQKQSFFQLNYNSKNNIASMGQFPHLLHLWGDFLICKFFNQSQQWQMQDFPRAPNPKLGVSIYIYCKVFPKNCMNGKKLEPAGYALLALPRVRQWSVY